MGQGSLWYLANLIHSGRYVSDSICRHLDRLARACKCQIALARASLGFNSRKGLNRTLAVKANYPMGKGITPTIEVMVIKAAASANRAKNRLFERHKKNDEMNVPGIMLNTPRAKPAVVMPSPLDRIDRYQ